MHAYILVGQGITNFQLPISNLATKLGAKIFEFPIAKIEDVRNLNSLIRLSFEKPTLVVSRNIHEAGEEALNAFLKNLEEPQENIYFALTTHSVKKVLSTVVSRCQIIKIRNNKLEITNEKEEEIGEFLKMGVGEKLAYVDKIKDREVAIEFTENMVFFMHRCLHEKGLKYSVDPKNVKLALKTLTRLNANGNVNLQLSNFSINYK